MRDLALRIEHVALDQLVRNPRNSRLHSQAQIERIAASMARFGFTNPILVDEGGVIIAGHGRLLGAQRLKLLTVPVITARGWTDAEKRAYLIADNQLALDAGWVLWRLRTIARARQINPPADLGARPLLVYPFGEAEGGRCNFISNGADRRDVVRAAHEAISIAELFFDPLGLPAHPLAICSNLFWRAAFR